MWQKGCQKKPLSVTYVEARFEHPADVPFAVEPQRRGDLFMPSVMLNGSAKAWLCVLNMTDHQVTLKRNIELGCAVETDVLVVPREESNGGEQNKAVADVYLRGPVQDSEQEGLKVCSIKVSGDQETGLVMEDATTVEQDGKASSEPGGAVEQSGEMGKGHEQESVEISGKGNPEHKVAAGLSYVTELSAGTLAEEDPSVVHKSNKEVNQPHQAETRELPEHLQDLFDRAKELLTLEQAARVKKALLEFADVFAKTDLDIGQFTALVHYLKTGQAFPIKQSMRRTPLGFEKQEKATLDQMLSAGVIEHSHSEWASPPLLVRKRDGSWRYCIDFRAVNAVTEKDAYPLPLIEECLDSLAGKSWFCTLDMNSGYWQIPIADEDRCKTAFITKFGLFQFTRMPFGLCGAPATFRRAMHMVLGNLIWDIVIVYLDDINVLGETFEETLANLVRVLTRFREFGLKLKPRKCHLFRQEADFLGRWVDAAGVHVTDDHIKDVLEWPVPKCRKDLERFLGFVNYHREFVQGTAGRTAPLYQLTGSCTRWNWTEERQRAFEDLKKVMTSPPVLGFPNARDLFVLDKDASDLAIGAELSQVQDGKERVISYASKTLNSGQQKYCTTRKELLSVVVFTRHYRHYLLCRQFVVRTDHASLVWLMRFKQSDGLLSRWLQELGQYDFSIVHRSGKKHSNADGLSRNVPEGECECYMAGKDVATLPCGGCDYCTKMQGKWRRYEEDVDDILPLAYGMSLPEKQCIGVQVPEESVLDGDDDGDTLMELGPGWDQGYRRVQDSVGIQVPEEESHQGTASSEPEITKEQGGSELSTGEACSVMTEDQTQRLVRQLVVVDKADGDREAFLDGIESNFMAQVSLEEWQEHQRSDTDLGPVIQWLQSDVTPTQADLTLQNPTTKHLWLCRKQLQMKQGVLFYEWDHGVQKSLLLVIPRSLKDVVIGLFHDTKVGGHLGREKTKEKIRQQAYWYGMTTDVDMYVATCRQCNLNKKSRSSRAPLQNFQAGYPGDRVHLDILGPFLESYTGHKYVLMIVDQFTRWLEMVSLATQDAESVAKAFFEAYVVRFGVPWCVHTDQGRNFDSELFQTFCSLLEAAKTRTTPYRPSANGQVERYNQLVLNFLRCFLGQQQRQWDTYLPSLGMSVRSMVNRNTGFTPNFLQLGREIHMPADVMFAVPLQKDADKERAEYARQLVDQLGIAYAQVWKNLRGAQRRQKLYYDVNTRLRKFEVGDLVYRRKESWKAGLSRKLCPSYTGPFVVTQVLSPSLYRVEDLKHAWVLHHDKLKLCNDRRVPHGIRRKRHEVLRDEAGSEEDTEHTHSGVQTIEASELDPESGEDEMEALIAGLDVLQQHVSPDDMVSAGSAVEEDGAGSGADSLPEATSDGGVGSDEDQGTMVDSSVGVDEDSDVALDCSKLESVVLDGMIRAEDCWMAVEDWQLDKLFHEDPKSRSGRTLRKPARFR